ncbi:MAG: ABC transporter permease [Chloroflexota bacterium]
MAVLSPKSAPASLPKVRPTMRPRVQPRTLAILAAMAALGLLVVAPIGVMAVASLRPAGVLPLDPGEITFQNFARVFGGPEILTVLGNTLVYAILGVLFALPLALGLAVLTERTDMPMRHALYGLMFIPMSIPVFATALGWVLLLGPRAGTLNQWIRLLTGSEATDGPINIFSMGGLIFVYVLGLVPSMWLFLIGVLRNMDPALEEAAYATGASKWTTWTRVTFPLMRPGIAAVVVYFLMVGIETLELPLALGPTAGVELLSTRIFFTLLPSGDKGADYGIPASFGLVALLLGAVSISLYLYLVRRASSYAVVAGKAYRPRLLRLGSWKYLALSLVGLYLLIKVILPFAVLVYASLLQFYQPPVPKTMDNLRWTLAHYEQLFDYRFFGRYFVNSIVVAVAAATLTMVLVSAISWMVVRWPSPLTRLLNGLAFMPLGIPGLISTMAFFLLFIGTPISGSILLMTLAFTARFLAFGTRLMHSAQLQIHRELEEAAVVSGVSAWTTFLLINLRLLIAPFLNGWLWVLVHAAKDFSVGLLLATATSALVGNVIYGAFTGGRFPQASAMMVALVVFNLAIVYAGRKWIVRALAERA